ncbi:MAG: hypothetical protein IH851_09635, partial [Armatimonadetes bacterium]|nr:hypothetical protein [Armatimonadota bacterium]
MSRKRTIGFSIVAAAALALPLTLAFAGGQRPGPDSAQRPGLGQPGQQPPLQRGPGQRMGMGPGQMMMGGGGGPQMRMDDKSVFILMGNRLFKVDKATMSVTDQAELPFGPRRDDRPQPPRGDRPPPIG